MFSRVVDVARRLPSDAPYDATTFVDIVSTPGATLRILPWTWITGHHVTADETERARSLVHVIAAHAAKATLDPPTKVFADGTGQAPQLPTIALLATHDSRLA